MHGNLERSHGEREFEGLTKGLWGGVEGNNMNKGSARKMRRVLGETFQWWREGGDKTGNVDWGHIGVGLQ